MKKNNLTTLLWVLVLALLIQCKDKPQHLYLPDEHLGVLFHDVQTSGLFDDSKTFVDCTPLKSPQRILEEYQKIRHLSGFNLDSFVYQNFQLPQAFKTVYSHGQTDMVSHIVNHWDYLTRQPDNIITHQSLIPLPYPYVVPGGRFGEIYYWDSYFTMEGLAASARMDLAKNMLDNFAYLIDNLGFIPNGNRTYYLSRSQPPFFASMVTLYGQETSKEKAAAYLPQLIKEYEFWMDGYLLVTDQNPYYKRVVKMPDGSVLNRYWDEKAIPRPESYMEDLHLAKALPKEQRPQLYRNIRAACESGWDFSSRWFEDPNEFHTINTTEIIPVDLNCLLYNLEMTISQLHDVNGAKEQSGYFRSMAQGRKKAIEKYFWSENEGFYMDYNFTRQNHTSIKSSAAVFPLYFGLATQNQADMVAQNLEKHFLKPGGLLTTLNQTNQQWDYPNGWAPLQWIAIIGLHNYKHHILAENIKQNWLLLNEKIFLETGKMMEKYNVVNIDQKGGGGEYPLQDGFGWTNGVNIALIKNKEKTRAQVNELSLVKP
jgi:alpha,alpha-trehalase